jgi:hypothetical protein
VGKVTICSNFTEKMVSYHLPSLPGGTHGATQGIPGEHAWPRHRHQAPSMERAKERGFTHCQLTIEGTRLEAQ